MTVIAADVAGGLGGLPAAVRPGWRAKEERERLSKWPGDGGRKGVAPSQQAS